MRTRYAIIFLLLILLGIGGFFVFRGAREIRPTEKLQVVTTFLPMYVFAKNVAGDLADVENLLPRGAAPHDYAFEPSDILKVAKADVVIKNGRGIDDWLDAAVSAAGRADLRVITASDGIEPHTGSAGFSPQADFEAPAPKLPLQKPDPKDSHVWLDPFLAIKEVENIRNSLMAADPANANGYARNAEEYLLKLLALDTEIRQDLAKLSKREFVAFHSAFRYFAYEYELREVAVIEEFPGKDPTPAELAKLAKDIEKYNVKVIFSEPQFSPKIVETLARDYGLRIAQLDPFETGDLDVRYYEEVMRKNVQTIVEALE